MRCPKRIKIHIPHPYIGEIVVPVTFVACYVPSNFSSNPRRYDEHGYYSFLEEVVGGGQFENCHKVLTFVRISSGVRGDKAVYIDALIWYPWTCVPQVPQILCPRDHTNKDTVTTYCSG